MTHAVCNFLFSILLLSMSHNFFMSIIHYFFLMWVSDSTSGWEIHSLRTDWTPVFFVSLFVCLLVGLLSMEKAVGLFLPNTWSYCAALAKEELITLWSRFKTQGGCAYYFSHMLGGALRSQCPSSYIFVGNIISVVLLEWAILSDKKETCCLTRFNRSADSFPQEAVRQWFDSPQCVFLSRQTKRSSSERAFPLNPLC